MKDPSFAIRKMDDMGKVQIPEEIQTKLGIKKSELPEFEIKLYEEGDNSHIRIYLIK